ncbi:MAG: helix-turn-helix transcriptional regulator [Clostridiaceae bacterium]|nr:helix-turn-helix transcriptional regulator [Clostridiaceae bacterium]
MTQQELSVNSEINQAVLSRIESGKANPSIRALQKVAKGRAKNFLLIFVDAGPVHSFNCHVLKSYNRLADINPGDRPGQSF